MSEREWLLAAIRRRLQAASDGGDPSAVTAREALDEAGRLERLVNGDDLEAFHLLGWLHLFRFRAGAPDSARSLETAVDLFTVCFVSGVRELPEPMLPVLALRAMPSGLALLQQALATTNLDLISACVALWRDIVDALPEEDDHRAGCLSNLSGALRARFDRTGQPADLDAAIDAAQVAVATAPEGEPLRGQVLSNLAGSLRARFELASDVADLNAAIEAGQAAVGSVPAGVPERPSYQNNLALALKARFHQTGAREDLDAALSTFQEVAAATAPDHPYRGTRLSNVGISLQERFDLDGRPEDLDAAIDIGRAAVSATPAGHPRHAVHLSNLATALRMRYERAASPEDLRALVEVCEQALASVPQDHPTYAAHLTGLAEALRMRFLLTETDADLEAAVGAARALLGQTPRDDPEWRSRTLRFLMVLLPWAQRGGQVDYLGDLADLADLDVVADIVRDADVDASTRALMLSFLTSLLQRRYERSGTKADADALVTAARQAVAISGPEHHDHPMRLSQLSVALRSRFERTGEEEDLEAAIEAGQASVAAAGPGHAVYGSCVSHLSLALQARFALTGDTADLARAIDGFRTAVESDDGASADAARRRANLAQALTVRFEQTGAAEDLDAAIDAGREALASMSGGGPDRAKALANLGVMLRIRFGHTGVLADLDEAAGLGREAVSCTPADHPDLPGYLAALGAALRLRYERVGAAGDLDAAVEVCGEAARLVPGDHPDRARYMSTFGIALRARYARNRVASDLDLAVEAGRAAAAAPAGGPLERPRYLANLVGMLMSRFEVTGSEADLDEAEAASAEAVLSLPPGHPDHALHLNNRGAVLRARFLRRGVPADLDAAIDATESAVRLAPAERPRTAAYLANLGLARSMRFERTRDQADLDAALGAYERVARTVSAAPSQRIRAARAAADLIASEDPGRAADLLEAAVRLLPEVTPRRLGRGDQQDALAVVSGLAADAAALALAVPDDPAPALGDPVPERAERALRLLEAGRAVLLSQILDTRSDLTDLYRYDPGLADRFVLLRDRLDGADEAGGLPAITGDAPENAAGTGEDDPAEERLKTAAELADLIGRIRALPGLESFGLPPSLDELRAEAVDGPIVTCNVGSFRSDALVLTAQGVLAVSLPGLDEQSVIEQIVAFHEALERATDAPSGAGRVAAQRTLLEILRWLWDEVAGPVLDALGIDGPPAESGNWPRLWWAPGGLLSLLPLHAAGHHADPGDPGRTVLDRVVSSYTPTIRALHHARRQDAASPAEPGRTLVVAVPVAPGVPGRLDHVPAEAAMVAERLPGPIVLAVPGEDGPAGDSLPIKAEVLRLLPDCAIAHFACHGSNDPTDPSASRLLLLDHADDPLTVAALVPVRLDQVRLAYLSACSTAFTGRVELLDEAIHLAGAFQLAGFSQVVGTLWEIDDQLAVVLADSFYRGLCAGAGVPDTSRSALALHDAVRGMRARFLRSPSL